MTNHVDWAERQVKLSTIFNISKALNALRHRKERGRKENIEIAQLEQRRQALSDTMRPFVVVDNG